MSLPPFPASVPGITSHIKHELESLWEEPLWQSPDSANGLLASDGKSPKDDITNVHLAEVGVHSQGHHSVCHVPERGMASGWLSASLVPHLRPWFCHQPLLRTPLVITIFVCLPKVPSFSASPLLPAWGRMAPTTGARTGPRQQHL
jgi:hypothetical protein